MKLMYSGCVVILESVNLQYVICLGSIWLHRRESHFGI